MDEPIARTKEGTNVFKILTGNPEGNMPSIRPRCKSQDNNRMNLHENKMSIRGIGLIRLRRGNIGGLL